MKKLILTTAMAFVMILSMNAQNSAFIIGVNGGANLSKIKTTNFFSIQGEELSRKLGFQGGVDLGFKYSNFSFLTGVKYIQGGVKSEIEKTSIADPIITQNGITDTGFEFSKNTYASINIPLLLRYQTSGDLSFSLTLGPVITKHIGDYKSETTYRLANNDNVPTEEYTATFGDLATDVLKNGTMSFMFSPGVLYKVGESGYLRFNVTLTASGDIVNDSFRLYDDVGNEYTVNGSIKSSALAFEIGYEHRIDFTMGAKY